MKKKKIPNNKRKEIQICIPFMEMSKPKDFIVHKNDDNDDFEVLLAADRFKEKGCTLQNFTNL